MGTSSTPPVRTSRRTAAVAIVALVAVATMGPAATGSARSPQVDRAHRRAAEVVDLVQLRPLSTSADHRIVDDLGRDVLLRGANVNSLGEYWQGVPTIPTTIDLTEADWDAMAAHGFSVIRLLITWSRVEPVRGSIDQAYLDRVDAYVRAAAAHGIYSVIDMHQDAYSAFIFTTDPASCPDGTSPAKGWDGAPQWATRTDGLSTCVTGDRNSSPAVTRAWNNFYDDVDGIRGEFAFAWGAVAAHFAGRPEVAGYDLLNEPEVSRPAAELTPRYEALLHDTAAAIRAAEADAPFDHILIVEPAIPAGDPSRGLVIPDPGRVGMGTANVVASVHNYAESITSAALDFTIEELNDLVLSLSGSLGLATWGGEYGFWDTDPATLAKVRRYAADEDANALGGAWWQWRQSCGDPHAVQWQDGVVTAPTGESTHLNRLGCPGNVDLGPTDAFLDVLGRAYPRTTPGRITSLTSDPASGAFALHAAAGAGDAGHQLVVWTPTTGDASHAVSVDGLTDVQVHTVPGGRIVTATVTSAGAYALFIGPRPATAPPTGRPGGAPPAVARPGRPTFTG
jgi:endoglycosylceramidase